jgi:hypothetical protein
VPYLTKLSIKPYAKKASFGNWLDLVGTEQAALRRRFSRARKVKKLTFRAIKSKASRKGPGVYLPKAFF